MRILLLLVLAAALGACASPRPAAPSPTPASEAPPAATVPATRSSPAEAKASLLAEQTRLADLFRGTPVVFAMQSDGSMRVTVPLRYSFDKGRAAVKPPLGAVLDRVAKGQVAGGTRLYVAAPADPKPRDGLLANQRASSARDYMVARGILLTRFTISAAAAGDAVIIVVADLTAH